jgi:hypothetical protein
MSKLWARVTYLMNASFLEAPFRCTPCRARYGNPFWIAHLKPMRSVERTAINRRCIARLIA